MPKLSIIIPVYNAEKYILRCLQSIEKQPFSINGGVKSKSFLSMTEAQTAPRISVRNMRKAIRR